MNAVAVTGGGFDAAMYAASLAYYGKPPDYPRVFTPGMNSTLPPATPPRDCVRGQAVWLQANETAPNFVVRKPGTGNITTVTNITLDFEHPQEPGRVHRLARAYVARLIARGLVPEGQPIEDSGAGAHIVIPIPAIICAEHGGSEVVNDAVASVVAEYFAPLFAELAAAEGLPDLELDAYDIARVISVPGTWRPGGKKPGEAPHLLDGYLRQWLPPHDARLPVRRESQHLRALIIEATGQVEAEVTTILAETRKEAMSPPGTDERPGDHYNRTATARDVAALLCENGWGIEHEGADRIVLHRPGKRDGTSATIRSGTGIPILYSFSTNCPPFQPKKGYTPFSVVTKLKYGDDPAAAARALAREHLGGLHLLRGVGDRSTNEPGDNGPRDPLPDAEPEVPPLRVDEELPNQPTKFLIDCHVSEEYGDATLLAALFRGRLVYDHGRKTWFFWGGHRWREDRTSQVVHLVGGHLAAAYLRGAATLEQEAAALRNHAKESGDHDKADQSNKEADQKQKAADAMAKRARDLRMHRRLVNVLTEAHAFLPITGDEWDAKPDLLAVANGVIDLTTGEMHPGLPGDYLRTAATARWEGIDAPAPRWARYLAEMFASMGEVPDFLQRALGYGISGHTTEHKLLVLHGPGGRNGKDVLLGVLAHVLGEGIASAVSADVLLGHKGRGGAAEPHLMDLQGKRICWVSETNAGAKLNAGQVKLITGGGQIAARPLYGGMVKFEPAHFLLLITNDLPAVGSDDDALWSRIMAAECKELFLDAPDPANPHEHPRDPRLGEKLRGEASGVLAWLVRGHLAWRAGGLKPPRCVLQTTDAYRAGQDELAEFIEAACVVHANASMMASALYEAYTIWTGAKQAMPARAFGERMGKRFKRSHTKHGNVYAGIGLRGD